MRKFIFLCFGLVFYLCFPLLFMQNFAKINLREAILLGVNFLMFSFILIMGGIYQLNFWLIAASLVLFFVGFSIFEPIFPSLVIPIKQRRN